LRRKSDEQSKKKPNHPEANNRRKDGASVCVSSLTAAIGACNGPCIRAITRTDLCKEAHRK
jgi:hypothetical protein